MKRSCSSVSPLLLLTISLLLFWPLPHSGSSMLLCLSWCLLSLGYLVPYPPLFLSSYWFTFIFSFTFLESSLSYLPDLSPILHVSFCPLCLCLSASLPPSILWSSPLPSPHRAAPVTSIILCAPFGRLHSMGTLSLVCGAARITSSLRSAHTWLQFHISQVACASP